MTPAEARRLVLMHMLDLAATQAEAAHEAALRSPVAQPIAAEWDRQRERLVQAVQGDATGSVAPARAAGR